MGLKLSSLDGERWTIEEKVLEVAVIPSTAM